MMADPQIRDFKGKRVHMIGIGGSSMSGLARMLVAHGCLLTGSDNLETYATKELREQGVPVTIGHRAENIHGAELVVYTVAILPDNPERVEAGRLGLPTLERAILLGQLMDGYATAIAVCGTHGKTSTTSMLTQILVETGADPTAHIGGTLDYIGGNTRIGKGGVFITEACEFNGSFLHLKPTMAVLTNIDEDHLDFYKDIDDIQNAFGRFLALLPANGCAVGNGDDERVVALLAKLPCRVITFGRSEHCDWRPLNLRYDEQGYASFDAAQNGVTQGHVTLKVAGFFHVDNALAALACACALGAEPAAVCAAIGDFTGAHRRFELTGVIDGVKLYHDYGHNPTEMRNVLTVARMQPHNRLWAVMQPHTYSRVKKLFADYLTCTRDADITLVTDIYAAREKDPGDMHASQIVEGMRQNGLEAVLTPTFADAERYLRAHWQPGDLVLTLGCGNINQLNEQMNENEAQLAAQPDCD